MYSFIIGQHDQTLNWLAEQGCGDSERIGFYGLSYGGKTVVRVPPFLDRYALSICSGDFNKWVWKTTNVLTRYSYLLWGEYDMYEFNFANVANYGELANLMAPQPFMVERGRDDGVGMDEWISFEYAKVRRFYDTMGFRDNTTIEFFNGPHTIHGVGWPAPPHVFVSDLKPLHELVGEVKPASYAVKKAARFNRSVDGHALTNRDREFSKGVGVQAPSELVFPLEPKYKRFVAIVGVDDECMRWDNPGGLEQWPQWSRPIHGPTSYRICQIIFEVMIDGRTVKETPPLFKGGLGRGIDVEIPEGALQLTLGVKDVESHITDSHGHGDWLDAGFVTS